jgi:beta-galactosidase
MRHRFIALLVLFTVIFFSSAEAQTTARKFEARILSCWTGSRS